MDVQQKFSGWLEEKLRPDTLGFCVVSWFFAYPVISLVSGVGPLSFLIVFLVSYWLFLSLIFAANFVGYQKGLKDGAEIFERAAKEAHADFMRQVERDEAALRTAVVKMREEQSDG